MGRNCCFTRFFFFFLVTIYAQEGDDATRGRILDVETQEPVVFATIRIKGKAIGVISNQDGGFRIPPRFREMRDTLVISSMGYQKKEIPISGLSPEHINIIRLAPGVLNLSEAIVTGRKKRKLSAKQIVRRAIANLQKNYPQKPFSTIGYYRDYQLKDGNYVNLNEAVLEVFDQGFSRLDSTTTKVGIYEYKRNADFERDTLADDPYDYESLQKIVDNAYLSGYGGNEFSILRVHDAIRNYNVNAYSFVNRFDIDLLKNHSFSKDNSTYLNGEALYTVKFRRRSPNYSAFGTLYISPGDFAIHKMEYTLYDDRKRSPDRKLNKHLGNGQLIFEVTTEYQRHANRKMYLNYISFNNSFILWEPPKFRVDYSTIDLKRNPQGTLTDFRLELVFNRIPNADEVVDVKNYSVRYQGKPLKIKAAGHIDEKVFLLPDITQEERTTMMREIIEAREKELDFKQLFSIEVKPIYDVEGNRLHEWKKRNYNQFREYFVQQLKPKVDLPNEGEFMNRRRPIFEGQPISRPENFDDYWMNTPLKRLIQ
ncbi:carboxypeptidase-like regulatory domain-containing protein [Flavobacteriaceae bacterium TP-CH-4]|uniref:Carboxypeptidase-like regulatory domain-containing protein n=1 Tax=Pelagihabitans pacificus TaxID=2696054 RepID=A0A967AQ43_9FLAO|nr:carboxypeptidase-like regulatory domain-containing protein [Pelagihabitans pacificus]NHF57937.1 carboxypeptidase-like regulatory domain-containing protein [Pelagihabitans pacificus]